LGFKAVFVGFCPKINIKQVIDSILALSPKRIYTDGLNVYRHVQMMKVYKRVAMEFGYRN